MSRRPCLDLTPGSCGAAASGQDALGGRPVCAEPRPGVLHLILSTVPSPQLPPHRSPVSPRVHHQIQGMMPATHSCLSSAPEGWEPAVTSLLPALSSLISLNVVLPRHPGSGLPTPPNLQKQTPWTTVGPGPALHGHPRPSAHQALYGGGEAPPPPGSLPLCSAPCPCSAPPGLRVPLWAFRGNGAQHKTWCPQTGWHQYPAAHDIKCHPPGGQGWAEDLVMTRLCTWGL